MARVTAPARESLAAPPPNDVALLAIALTGISFSGPLMAATAAPALAIAFWRNAMGAGVTAATLALRRTGELRRSSRRVVGGAAVGGLALAAHFGTWVPSVTMTSVASATALVSTQTIFTALIAHVQGRRLPRAAWVGIAGATVAVVLITGADVGLSSRALAGDLLAVAGGLFVSIYLTIGARVRTQLTTASYTAVCYTVCCAALLLVCVTFGVPLGGYPAGAWLKIALVTVTAQLLGHSLLNVVLRSTSPTLVLLAVLLEVPGAALVAFVWLGQRPPLTAVPGLVLLIVALALVVRARDPDLPVDDTD